MKTVLLIGAGMTRSARPKIALNKRAPLDSDFFTIARSVNNSKAVWVISCLSKLVGDYADVLLKSLESTAAYLYIKAIDSENGSIYHVAFMQLLSLLNEVLAKTTNDIPVGPRSQIYRMILSELKKLDNPEDLSVVTFNYDLLIERSLESISSKRGEDVFAFPGCYRLEGISKTPAVRGSPRFASDNYEHVGVSVLKLHGSMNWQSKHTSDNPTPSALLNPKRGLHVLDSSEISKSLSWRQNSKRVYMKPIIVPPVGGKRGMMHNKTLCLWSKAAEKLRKADRVVIAGYSCPPLDLEARILISESLRMNENKKVYVIDPSAESAAKFVDLCGVDHMTIYSSVNHWIRDARP